jgi:hypothetical protein
MQDVAIVFHIAAYVELGLVNAVKMERASPGHCRSFGSDAIGRSREIIVLQHDRHFWGYSGAGD